MGSLSNIDIASIVRGRTRVFCETGCSRGDGLRWAVGSGLFTTMLSCDIDERLVRHCAGAFRSASVFCMDSVEFLEQHAPQGAAMFWLDAHDPSCGTFPLLEEIAVIKSRDCFARDIVVVDDIDALPGWTGKKWRVQMASPSWDAVCAEMTSHDLTIHMDSVINRPIAVWEPR